MERLTRIVNDRVECNVGYCPEDCNICGIQREQKQKLAEYEGAAEQGLLLRNPKDLENTILDRMKVFMDEWTSYSESSVDHFGGKADSMETAMKIVKDAFEQAIKQMKGE